jgi:hypothetical protein
MNVEVSGLTFSRCIIRMPRKDGSFRTRYTWMVVDYGSEPSSWHRATAAEARILNRRLAAEPALMARLNLKIHPGSPPKSHERS